MLRKGLNGLVAAVQLLSRVPLPVQVPFDPPTLAVSLLSFPLAGLLIGVLTAGASALFQLLDMPLLAAALTLGWWIALTGGLHLDGWMDTADGVLSGRPREQMLEIMKDSRVGAMGVIAGFMLLLVKFAALVTLFERTDSTSVWMMLALGPVWSRWWMTAAIVIWPSAREGGMGAMFRAASSKHAAGAAVMAIAVSVAVAAMLRLEVVQSVVAVAVIAGAAAAVGLLLAIWLGRKLGGLTGDTYGAMNEASEAAGLIAICLLCTSWTL
ncbi:adenosylcobinamide-GDP ribazoletransferase [Paenibacillus xylaniclasticus]|uniref:adenosylcobinamide-GDP ribazoletransferase n=1 Tax=Paenibacillus xylaniclasticus TaxID=588083 RepID=UPI000FD9E90C|nr:MULTISPECIES: adenosylcobinamide-GDP ribazoletransferase [Paenibacillus]